jgi:hypothetical protein
MLKLRQSDVIPETVSSICSARIETHPAEGLKPSDTSVETWSALVITSNQIKNSTTELKATVVNDPNLNETKVSGIKEKAIMVKGETGTIIVNEFSVSLKLFAPNSILFYAERKAEARNCQ